MGDANCALWIDDMTIIHTTHENKLVDECRMTFINFARGV